MKQSGADEIAIDSGAKKKQTRIDRIPTCLPPSLPLLAQAVLGADARGHSLLPPLPYISPYVPPSFPPSRPLVSHNPQRLHCSWQLKAGSVNNFMVDPCKGGWVVVPARPLLAGRL